ncbi:MAG TPA: DNA polymerase III subunit alpha [Candidatus Coprovivens excrementavium]|nr:DNA polymerase III subunit alpha [Candidatus Coprovivens excrementavium]
MYIPIGIKSDYSLLQSLIKIPDLISYLLKHNIMACGILDDNLFGSICFYKECIKNNIKPIIGLDVCIQDKHIYLYAKNYQGYKSLLKINTIKQQRELQYTDLISYKKDVICVLPYRSIDIYEEIKKIYEILFVGYGNNFEKQNASLVSKHIVYINEVRVFNFQDIRYLQLLREIDTGESCDLIEYQESYLERNVLLDDQETIKNFISLVDLKIEFNQVYIPHYDKKIEDSFAYLSSLCKKGLIKRLHNDLKKNYVERLMMELSVIKKMGFVDYFLIVYDYVRYAKTHNILVGPGRGSAAGSLVSYCLGITNIDPIEYDLLFERFLNPERVTMPDIDIDFEYTKRDQVVQYVKERYGVDKVANIMTFGTLGARQVIRDVGKCLKVELHFIDKLSNLLNPKLSLKDNIKNKYVKEYVMGNSDLEKLYKVSYKLEGLKRHISTHAAGVVISSVTLDDVIPVCFNGGELLTGVTMEYLEDLGLLKMDFLALRNLTIIQNVLELIEKETSKKINLADIPLDDEETMEIFRKVDTEGIFQYESSGMKNFLMKLKPDNFSDLVAAVALFRPGPMQNIDSFIRRKEGKEEVIYPDNSLKDILKDTYGIMIYQEQIMQVLVRMGNYSFAEADNIRRAMSKKKADIMEKERDTFVERATKNGYSKDKALEVYDLIIKFANYGFNKAHSVSYALIGYQMAYLKANYPVYFIANLLNMSVGSDIKTKEYIDEAKVKNILIFKPNINASEDYYRIKDNALLLPFNTIHNVGGSAVSEIIKERKERGKFEDFYQFVARTYGKSVNRKTLESLIDADCFRDFNINHHTLINSIDSALDYAVLCGDLAEEFVMKPNYDFCVEYNDAELMERELNTFGFYVTNHPSSKYQNGIMKIKEIKKYFDKFVSLVIIIDSIRKIKTKNGDDMGFFSGSDETGVADFIIFPKNNRFLNEIRKGDFVKVRGQVTRRNDKYQVVVSNIEKI